MLPRSVRRLAQLSAILCLLIANAAVGQQFRQPSVPGDSGPILQDSGQLPGTIISQQPAQPNQGFVPRGSNDGLGLGPVRPRSGSFEQNTDGLFRPDATVERSGQQERILEQIRKGEFDLETSGFNKIEGPQVIRKRYENGKDQLVRHVMQDKYGNYYNHGPWSLYNRRGELMASGQFVEGVMDGTWERWHTANSGGMFSSKPFTDFDGPFVSTATFSNGKLNGAWVISDRFRRKVVEVPYKNGKRNGSATWWYPSSERMRVINFKDGELDGPMLEWDEKSQLVRNDEFIRGQKVIRQTTMYRPKQPSAETYYLDGELSLEGEDNWWDAEPAEYVQLGTRVQHGPTYAWHSNGQRKMVGQYQNDIRVGQFMWWHENGQLSLTGRYDKDGLKVGQWTWWHEIGMKAIEGNYDKDQAVGEWVWWDENGKVKNRDQFGEGPESTGELIDPFEVDDEDEDPDVTVPEDQPGSQSKPPADGIDQLEEIRPESNELEIDDE